MEPIIIPSQGFFDWLISLTPLAGALVGVVGAYIIFLRGRRTPYSQPLFDLRVGTYRGLVKAERVVSDYAFEVIQHGDWSPDQAEIEKWNRVSNDDFEAFLATAVDAEFIASNEVSVSRPQLLYHSLC